MDKPLTVLVVDDSSQARLMVSRFVSHLGHIPLLACSGEEALELFTTHAPDLLLLDVQMPGIGGYEAARRVRALAGVQWVPIIFLSAAAEEDDIIKGLEAGGDDYLTKPVHFRLLEAKIHAMQRITEMQRLLRDNAGQLERYRDENEREQRLAKHLLDQLVRVDTFDEKGVERWMMPARHFSGDVLAAASAPSGALHVILADGTGHGLAAALSVIPVTAVFYSMTERGFTVSSIARELNRKLEELMPTGRFVAATLAAIHRQERTIEIWNGGNPPALFVRSDGRLLRSWQPMHPALGIMRSEDFSDRTESFRWTVPGQLLMCSDGLLEAESPTGEAFGAERMTRILLSGSPESRVRRLRTALYAHLDGQPAHDDISLLAVECLREARSNADKVRTVAEISHDSARPASRWRLELRLSAAELKTLDILPFLMSWVEQVKVEAEHRGQIFLVLAELFNNALDHGLLRLDSALKAAPDDGFERYITERATRLERLENGCIEMELGPVRQPDGEFLQLRVKDSGDGFDYAAMLGVDIAGSSKHSGRGVALVCDLCTKVTYLGSGSEVIAYYPLS
jgi:DNA-binding response OmpR family regulator/anti-sigma regulatory factor (Ser/Thr protein kinase)